MVNLGVILLADDLGGGNSTHEASVQIPISWQTESGCLPKINYSKNEREGEREKARKEKKRNERKRKNGQERKDIVRYL